MEATVPGQNRTGAAVSPKEVDLMMEAVRDLSPPLPINTMRLDVERQSYIAEADAIGSIPGTPAAKRTKSKKSQPNAETAIASIFLDKLGERIAFERTGTRLYTALITKYHALLTTGIDALPPITALLDDGVETGDASDAPTEEQALQTLQRIRNEELEHFHILCAAVQKLGGDPTAQTPCADVTAAASAGLMQVLTDPRTTLAQCLNTILIAELTDNAGWELLAQLAEEAGESEMSAQFLQALEVEQQHLVIVRGWLQAMLITEAGSPAV